MPLKGLTNAKNLLTPRTRAINLGKWLMTTWEHNCWSSMKPFVESSRLKKIRRCLKTMPKGALTDKQNMGRKTNLKESMESSKFE